MIQHIKNTRHPITVEIGGKPITLVTIATAPMRWGERRLASDTERNWGFSLCVSADRKSISPFHLRLSSRFRKSKTAVMWVGGWTARTGDDFRWQPGVHSIRSRVGSPSQMLL